MIGCSHWIAFCVFDDYVHYATRPRDYFVKGDYGKAGGLFWVGNFLQNPSMETGDFAGWYYTSGNRDVWCSGQ
jgi:hypothetical protein